MKEINNVLLIILMCAASRISSSAPELIDPLPHRHYPGSGIVSTELNNDTYDYITMLMQKLKGRGEAVKIRIIRSHISSVNQSLLCTGLVEDLKKLGFILENSAENGPAQGKFPDEDIEMELYLLPRTNKILITNYLEPAKSGQSSSGTLLGYLGKDAKPSNRI